MKKILVIIGMTIGQYCSAQTATIMASSKGIAPIPFFGLPDPAGMVFLKTNITKNLEFSPDATFNMRTGEGWFMDTWLRWNQPIDSAGKWIATVGFDWSLFFQEYSAGGNRISQSVTYPTYQAKLRFIPNKKNAFKIDLWYTYPIQKEYGVKGTYVAFVYTRTQEMRTFTLEGNCNIFSLNYSDGTVGCAASYDVACFHNKTGLFISSQFLHSLTVKNMVPSANVSLGITRKLF